MIDGVYRKNMKSNLLFDNYFYFTGRRRISQVKHENHRSHSSVNQRTIKLTSCRYFNRLTVFIVLLLSAICDVTGKNLILFVKFVLFWGSFLKMHVLEVNWILRGGNFFEEFRLQSHVQFR